MLVSWSVSVAVVVVGPQRRGGTTSREQPDVAPRPWGLSAVTPGPAQDRVTAPRSLSALVARVLDQLSVTAWLPAGALVLLFVLVAHVYGDSWRATGTATGSGRGWRTAAADASGGGDGVWRN